MSNRLKYIPKKRLKWKPKPEIETMKESLAFGEQMRQLGCNVIVHRKSGMVTVGPQTIDSVKKAISKSKTN